MAFNGSERGGEKKIKQVKDFCFGRRHMWLPAAETGLDVREAVNWQKQGHRFSPLPRLQWSSFTVGCPELPRDRKTVLRGSWSGSLEVSKADEA